MSSALTDYQRYIRLRSETGAWLAHPDLRPRLVASARERGVTLAEAVRLILGERYGVAVKQSRIRRQQPATSGNAPIVVWLPPGLDDAVARSARRHRRNMQDEMRAVLCEHFDLALPAKPRQVRAPRRPRAATA